jgi:hypothetical protein
LVVCDLQFGERCIENLPLWFQVLSCVCVRVAVVVACVWLRCVALRCVALRCVALRCVALMTNLWSLNAGVQQLYEALRTNVRGGQQHVQ